MYSTMELRRGCVLARRRGLRATAVRTGCVRVQPRGTARDVKTMRTIERQDFFSLLDV